MCCIMFVVYCQVFLVCCCYSVFVDWRCVLFGVCCAMSFVVCKMLCLFGVMPVLRCLLRFVNKLQLAVSCMLLVNCCVLVCVCWCLVFVGM